jgi:serpin B
VGAGKNVILSPYSVSSVMAMLDAGAAGSTAAQIERVLALPASGVALAPTVAALACDDETHASAGGNQLSIANALWGQKGMPVQTSFLSTLAHGYAAPLQQVDLAGDPTGATRAIDQWVSNQTQGAIPSLLQPGDLDASTRLALVNAVYFKGAWATAFDPSATRPQPFTLDDGTVVSVPTMAGAADVSRSAGDGFTIIELPYQGNQIAMDFLLSDGSLSELEAKLTPSTVLAALESLQPESGVLISLPRFSFDTRLVLNPVLAGMGMTDVFTPGAANLSGIDGAQDLYVKLAVQQAMIEVDEQGTVAAAATSTGLTPAIAIPPVAIAHPFLFLLRDTSTGSVLFMGRVEDPRAGS